jgi:hypothetical protein
LVLGRETNNFYPYHSKSNYLFEGELLCREHIKDFKYFPDLDIRFYDMLRKLFVEKNVDLSYLVIGNPLTEDDFAKYEKKIKRKIHQAVKEFYSILEKSDCFGHLELLMKELVEVLVELRGIKIIMIVMLVLSKFCH